MAPPPVADTDSPSTQSLSGKGVALQESLGYQFRDPELLGEALTHSSICIKKPSRASNERLEFLGDRVLGLVIAGRLYELYPDAREGALAYRYNTLVNRNSCARTARALSLGDYLVMSQAERQAGGADKDTILADACEALVAAVYLDGGFSAARRIVNRLWEPLYETVVNVQPDPKTRLQERAQKQGLDIPVYEVTERTGPDHAPRFMLSVTVSGMGRAEGEGKSKREAEQAAARALLAFISTGDHD